MHLPCFHRLSPLAHRRVQSIGNFFIGSFVMIGASGCSTLIGNVRPVEQKASGYHVMNLTEKNADWKRVDAQPSDEESTIESDRPDVTYQSTFTGSTISLNSACRASNLNGGEPLDRLMRVLLLGVTDASETKDTITQLDGAPALERTVAGKIEGEPVKIQALVSKKAECIYDLMYVSRPERFHEREADFAVFISSLRLR